MQIVWIWVFILSKVVFILSASAYEVELASTITTISVSLYGNTVALCIGIVIVLLAPQSFVNLTENESDTQGSVDEAV